MAKIVNLRAPESLRLEEMSQGDIEEYVRGNASRVLDSLPGEILPAGVNAVAIDALRPGTIQDPGFWVEWTRACCDARDRIIDFGDPPTLGEITTPGSVIHRSAVGEHLESQLRSVVMEYPQMHREGSAEQG
jgi:hypothetical protein